MGDGKYFVSEVNVDFRQVIWHARLYSRPFCSAAERRTKQRLVDIIRERSDDQRYDASFIVRILPPR